MTVFPLAGLAIALYFTAGEVLDGRYGRGGIRPEDNERARRDLETT